MLIAIGVFWFLLKPISSLSSARITSVVINPSSSSSHEQRKDDISATVVSATKAATSNNSTLKAPIPPLPKAVNHPTTTTKQKHNTFEHSLNNCFPHLRSQIGSPTEYVRYWRSMHPHAALDIDFIRYFFIDKKGNEIRAHVLYTLKNDRRLREFKIFKVLEDGLPDLVSIDPADRYNPSDTTLAKYINFTTVFETQKKWSAGDKDFFIEVEESNARVIEFQSLERRHTFRCHETDCECLKKN
ncbi:MAG: hypothetical protein JNL11_05475 [Bdellovibrionaceae bacterium]|nr:hypothetical protein [Pseudobdellovibrionaceae bacterium]